MRTRASTICATFMCQALLRGQQDHQIDHVADAISPGVALILDIALRRGRNTSSIAEPTPAPCVPHFLTSPLQFPHNPRLSRHRGRDTVRCKATRGPAIAFPTSVNSSGTSIVIVYRVETPVNRAYPAGGQAKATASSGRLKNRWTFCLLSITLSCESRRWRGRRRSVRFG